MWEPWFWLGLGVVGLTVELYAVYDKKRGDTLSEQVWRLRDLIPGGMIVLAVFMAWLTVHFVTG